MEGGKCPAAPLVLTDWHDLLTNKQGPNGKLDTSKVLFYVFGSGMDSSNPPQAGLWSVFPRGTRGCTDVAGVGCLDFWWAKEACPHKTENECQGGGGNVPTDSFPTYARSNMMKVENFGIGGLDIRE